MKKIILHIGTAKTGTTSLQSSFFANQEVLSTLGICYPNLTGCGFSWHINRGISTGNAHLSWKHEWPVEGDLNRLQYLIERTLNELDAASTGLLSAEYLSKLIVEEDFFALLNGIQTKFRCKIEVVAYVRDPFQMLISSYLQSILDLGFFGDLDDFVDDFLMSNQVCSFVFHRNLVNICLHAGKHGIDLNLYRYEDVTPDVVDHFYSNVLGLMNLANFRSLPEANKRMSKIDYDFIRGLNSYSYLFGHLISLEQRDLLLKNSMPVSKALNTPFVLKNENANRLSQAFTRYKRDVAHFASFSDRIDSSLDHSKFVNSLDKEQSAHIEFVYSLGRFVARSLESGYLRHHFENAININ